MQLHFFELHGAKNSDENFFLLNAVNLIAHGWLHIDLTVLPTRVSRCIALRRVASKLCGGASVGEAAVRTGICGGEAQALRSTSDADGLDARTTPPVTDPPTRD